MDEEKVIITDRTEISKVETNTNNEAVLVRQEEMPPITVYNNTQLGIIKIPVDRLELFARDYENGIKLKFGIRYLTGFAVTLLLALVSAEFKDNFGISSSQWKSLFTGFFFLAILRLLYDLFNITINTLSYFLKSYSVFKFIRKLVQDEEFIMCSKDFVETCREKNNT